MEQPKRFFQLRGFMRSGTNWIGNLLNLHPHICCTGEYHFDVMDGEFRRLIEKTCSPSSILSQEAIQESVVREYELFLKRLIEIGASLQNKKNAFVFVDRTPRPIDSLVMEGTRQIHVTRDGRDCLVSLTYHFLRLENDAFRKFPEMQKKRRKFHRHPAYFKRRQKELLDSEEWVRTRAKQWATFVKNDVEYIGNHRDSVLAMTYEEIHQETDKFRRMMYEFFEVDPDLAAPLNDKTTPGFRKENVASFYRKGVVGDWKSYFSRDVRHWFAEGAGEALIVAGYEENRDWIDSDG